MAYHILYKSASVARSNMSVHWKGSNIFDNCLMVCSSHISSVLVLESLQKNQTMRILLTTFKNSISRNVGSTCYFYEAARGMAWPYTILIMSTTKYFHPTTSLHLNCLSGCWSLRTTIIFSFLIFFFWVRIREGLNKNL